MRIIKTKINDIGLTPLLAFLALLFFGAPTITAAPGGLDPTFGQGGRVFTNIAVPGFTGFYPNTESTLVQPDGKVLVCGRFWEDRVSYWYGTLMVRYLPDGKLDTSFGDNGKVAVIEPAYPYSNPTVGADLALQPDGKILLIGEYTIGQGIIVRRYTSSGVMDTTFGNNGTTVVFGNEFEQGLSITLQPDGKIVGVGWDYNPYVSPYYDAILIFRLNPNGSLDSTFGSAGTGVVLINNGYDGAEVLVQPDGKILVVGTLLNFTNFPAAAILLARYNPDGSPDSSFGTGGKVTHRVNDQDSYTNGAALQPDGKIVLTGAYTSGSQSHPIVARYHATGSLDTGFGANGVVSLDSSLSDTNTVLVQPDGKINVIGNAYDGPGGHNDFAIVRLTSNGSLDPTFGAGGRSVFPINAGGTNYAYASNGALQPDGKILVTGYFGNYYTNSHETIALIRVDGGQSSCPNPIDCNEFFVRQHYQDFLNREPDAAGLEYWSNKIIACAGDTPCIDSERVNVSAAFFLSIEFQETGYLVYRTYKASYGNLSGAPVPIRLNEFLPDTQQIGHGVIVNQPGWQQLLENNQQNFFAGFVQRSRFTSAFPTSLTPDQFVDQLFLNAGVAPAVDERAAAMNEFGGAANTGDTAARARALRHIAENAMLAQQEFNRAFVLMQYFGYLRRNPNDAPEPGLNFDGYNFWLNKLNQFNGNFVQAEMVKSFLVSTEYRQRFGS